ncbi:MAG: UvrD-helicase domain-containing protein [Cyanobacteria bacterium P01_F01_bin.3]
MLDHAVRLVMSIDFLDAFSQLPKQIQSKTSAFIQKFKQTPTSSGLNYESIQNAADPNLKSLRVDQTYRAIVRKPDSGNAYLLLWVDKHDEAYAWAQRKMCKVNPESGALQIIDVEAASALESELSINKQPQVKGRFDDIRDRHLVRLGVPEEMLGAVRAVVTDDDVDKLLPRLPEEAADSLLMLASGYLVEEVLNLQDQQKEQTVDPTDIERALEQADSQRRFHVITDDDELLEMLAAPLDKWRVFLHPSQRRLVNRDWNGPVRVLGGAGTGKTVVAMHRAKWLVEKRFTDTSDRILFTTFTRNLATDIEANLRKICSPEVMRRIKVENLDSWVTSFLKAEGAPTRVVYGNELDELWQQAFTIGMDKYPETFFKDEWKQVIQPQNITSLQAYFKASRVGRGTRLNRMQRAAVWPVFEEFRALMKQKGLKDREDAMYDACSLLKNKPEYDRPYQSIIVDEAQDMGPADFALIRALVTNSAQGNDIFIVGDPHQRIYGRKVTLSHCGIEVRGRSRKLRINYRTTDETRKWATALLAGLTMDDLDGGSDDLTDYRSLMHGDEPWMQGFESFHQEVEFIHSQLQKLEQSEVPLSSVCIVVRSNALAKSYASQLKHLGIETRAISRSEADNPALPGVRIATMHRVKGLQFEHVFLAGLTHDKVPPQNAISTAADKAAQNAILKAERCLLHVSATRAKKGVFVTYHGEPSELLSLGQ